ncbi:hypothetical protein L596_019836 [Steinernema carpocapsae]|uniref:Uncharacterized protein n=1 Tax=Steinernema carpocapsae TaxID=34508 RepID=A0A4U5MSB8_STECR|nr:hypothetical protein L596_019836 [Steinernema carpocapsae]
MQTDPESYSIFAPTLVHLKTTVKKLEVSYEIKPGGESFTLSFKKENRKRTHDNEESQTTYKCLLHSSTDDYCSILTALNNTSEEDQEMLIQGDSEFSSWILKSKKDLLKEPKNALAQLLLRNIEFENRLKTMETELGLIQDTIKNIERFQGKVVEQMDKKAENESQVETNRHIASWVKHAIFTLLDRNRVTFFTKEALMFYLTGHEDPVAAEHVARISGAFRRSTMPHTVSLADKQKVVLFKFLVFEIAKNRVEAEAF